MTSAICMVFEIQTVCRNTRKMHFQILLLVETDLTFVASMKSAGYVFGMAGKVMEKIMLYSRALMCLKVGCL